MSKPLLVIGAIVLAISFLGFASTRPGPRWDWATTNGGWCCAKPKKWCRDATVCAQEGGNGNSRYCTRYEQANICTDVCEEWRKEPGGRGGACTPAAKPSTTTTCAAP